MKCPHCAVNFHDNWSRYQFLREGTELHHWFYRTANCPSCLRYIIEIEPDHTTKMIRVFPIGTDRGAAPPQVPSDIASVYAEACLTLPFSPMASAALSRRCLQAILHNQGYVGRDLAKQIDALLNEQDPMKAVPMALRETVDAVRNFGNFSAHPINDQTTLQIIDVEPEEAEWCLDIILTAFEHYYVTPSIAANRKAVLNQKLIAAGKPLAK